MNDNKVIDSSLSLYAKRERGALVPYGSTFTALPDDVDITLRGQLLIRIDPYFRPSEFKDAIREALGDHVIQMLVYSPGGCEEYVRVVISDYDIVSEFCSHVVIEPTDIEYL
jgi:hypothetical protein